MPVVKEAFTILCCIFFSSSVVLCCAEKPAQSNTSDGTQTVSSSGSDSSTPVAEKSVEAESQRTPVSANRGINTPVQTEPTQKKSNLALGIPIPNLVYADDVKKYMREILSAPLPAGYVLPDDVRLTGDYGKSVAKVNEHFPEFTNLESEELLRAVKANPVRYQEMMLEARSVREFYFPGSQPKLPK